MPPLLESPSKIDRFRSRLLKWYDGNKRSLPWRDGGNAYHVWVSEIMLQQTQVARVRGYFERFVRAFPTVYELAAATEADVLKAWEGMGYYARARNMRRAAQQVVEEHGGRIPAGYDELMSLPGVGTYTAAAVSSIAYDRDHPALDGNVTRVLCRLLRVEEDPRRSRVKTDLIAAAERLLARGRAGDFNQAMMELGARVCAPANPRCDMCPVRRWCRAARELDEPASLPTKSAPKDRPHIQVAAGLIWKKRQLLIARRPSQSMLGGLWEFPGGKQEPGESLVECLKREIREELDIEIEVGEHLASVDHGFSHFSMTLNAFAAQFVSGVPKTLGCAAWKWVKPHQLENFAMPRADRRVLELVDLQHSQPAATACAGGR